MAEKDTIFSSKIKYSGIFSFNDFYEFCYSWLSDELGLTMTEKKYSEKLAGDTKTIDIEWTGNKKYTDYFRYEISVDFQITGLKKVEVTQNGVKVNTNSGSVEIKVKGVLSRDYEGKFETSAFNKFLRGIYEKWVIPGRITEFNTKVANDSSDFLDQAKAWLDLEGKK